MDPERGPKQTMPPAAKAGLGIAIDIKREYS